MSNANPEREGDPAGLRSVTWYQVVLSAIGDAVLTTDPQGLVTYLNPVAEGLTGWPAAEAFGKRLEDVFRIVNEATGKAIEQPVRKVIETGLVRGLANHTVLIARDGSALPIDDSATPVWGDDGTLVGVVMIFRDVRERRESEKLVELARGYAESIVGTIREPLLILNADLHVKSANRAFYETFRVQPAETEGRFVYELGRGQWNIPALKTLLEEIIPQNSQFDDFEVEYDFEAIGRKTMSLNACRFPPEGQWDLILLAIGDVTERKRLETEREEMLRSAERARTRAEADSAMLTAADRHKNEFLAMLAHELRNPLAAVRNAVEVATRSGSKEDLDWSRDVTARQVRNFGHIINDLLDVARITEGKVQLNKERLDAGPVIRHAAEAVKPLVGERRHELLVPDTAAGPWLEADSTRLEQILVNLLTNAAKYTPSGGRIELTAGVEGKEVVFRVRDNGLGIPPEVLPKMFDLFAQGDRSLDRAEGGLGIGLTLVRSLAELHGGTVNASSEGPGKGCEFVVRLPAPDEPPPAEPDARPGPPASKARPLRVLVVDDNQDTANGMARLLKLSGHEARVAHDGVEALKVAREYRPEILLLDIGLPGMDGYELASSLRREEWSGDSVLVAISGYGEAQARERAKESGFQHYLVKPVDFDTVLALLGGS